MPPRAKKVLKEIPLDSSDSEQEEQVEEQVEEQKQVEEPVKRSKKIVAKPKDHSKKLEALRIANEARLRRKVEREILEKQQAKAEKERELEEKILSLIGRHLPAKEKPPKKARTVRKPREPVRQEPPQFVEYEQPQPQASPLYYQPPSEQDMLYRKIFG